VVSSIDVRTDVPQWASFVALMDEALTGRTIERGCPGPDAAPNTLTSARAEAAEPRGGPDADRPVVAHSPPR
jgi:hypothetical protein